MKRYLFKFFALALCLTLGFSAARADAISPSWQIKPSKENVSDRTGVNLDNGNSIASAGTQTWFYTNGGNVKGSTALSASADGNLWLISGGQDASNYATKYTWARVTQNTGYNANKGIGVTVPSGGATAVMAMTTTASLDKTALGFSLGKTVNVYKLSSSGTSYLGKVALDYESGDVVGTWGTMTNGRIAFANVTSNKIYYLEVKNSTINFTPKTITLSKSASELFTNVSDNLGARSRAEVKFLDDGTFFISYNGGTPLYFEADGTYVGRFPQGDMPAAGYGCSSEFVTYKGQKYAFITAASGVNTNATVYVYNWTKGLDKATLVHTLTPSYGALSGVTDTGHKKTSFDIVSKDNGLYWAFLMQPARGVAAFKVQLPEPPVEVINDLKATQKWNGETQTTSFTWTAGTAADHYVIYRGETAGTTGTVIDNNVSGKATSFTYEAPTGLGYQAVYTIQAVDASGNQLGDYASVSLWDLPFGYVDLTAELLPQEDGTSNVKLDWNAPEGGTVNKFEVVQRLTLTDDQNNTKTEVTVLANLTAATTSYTLKDYQTVSSKTIDGVAYSVKTELRVRAVMNQNVTTESGTVGRVLSNLTTPTTFAAPNITEIETYTGRTSATLHWTYTKVDEWHLAYYDVYRDGVCVKTNLESARYTDMNLSNGEHSYYVEAIVYKCQYDATAKTWNVIRDSNGNPVTEKHLVSQTVNCSIERNRLVTGYGLEEVYNYPIYTPDEWAAAGSPDKAVVAKGAFANAKDKVGAWGSPGDAYRQAQFYDGYWYIAALTSAKAQTYSNGTYISNQWTATELKKTFTERGGIFKIGARGKGDISDPRKISEYNWDANTNELVIHYAYPLENQSIAMTEDGVFWRRSLQAGNRDLTNNGPNNSTAPGSDLFYLPNTDMYCGSSHLDVSGQNFPSQWIDAGDYQQHYRTHYLSAGGKYSDGTDYVLMAMNKSLDCYRINHDGTVVKYQAPDKEGNVATDDKVASTENYAFPVVGRDGCFIHQVRGHGTYYVTKDGKYTLIYNDETDVTNGGGVTFKYNDELFLVHPTAIRSNNTGHFAIDMATRADNQTADEASFAQMIPVAAFTQDALTGFSAGNSNANWFGAEYDETDDCIYIYQYVPGVRFAKYRFYKYISFPGTTPTLTIDVIEQDKANGTGKEIINLNAEMEWPRPSEDDGYKPGESTTEYLVGQYNVEFLDKSLAPVKTWNPTVAAGSDVPVDTKYSQHYGNATTENNITENMYAVRVTPIYVKKADNTITVKGEGGMATARNDYPASIGDLHVISYAAADNSKYRVELDFDRATMTPSTYPLHVSFFTLEVSSDNGANWSQIDDFKYIWKDDYRGNAYQNVEDTYQGEVSHIIPGDYLFGVDGEENMTTRLTLQGQPAQAAGTSYKGKAAVDSKTNCVAYYYTTTDPRTLRYRAVAHYAANNQYIHKEVPTEAVTAEDGGTTGVDAVIEDNNGSVAVYPVPATTTITVNAPEAIQDIRIISLSGAVVVRNAGDGDTKQTVDVSTLAPGLYMVVINDLNPVRLIKR